MENSKSIACSRDLGGQGPGFQNAPVARRVCKPGVKIAERGMREVLVFVQGSRGAGDPPLGGVPKET